LKNGAANRFETFQMVLPARVMSCCRFMGICVSAGDMTIGKTKWKRLTNIEKWYIVEGAGGIHGLSCLCGDSWLFEKPSGFRNYDWSSGPAKVFADWASGTGGCDCGQYLWFY
jgi:hypothetical protein